MKPTSLALIILPVLFFSGGHLTGSSGEEHKGEEVRRAILAGSWYPANPETLKKGVTGYLSKANPEIPKGEIKAVIVPHAGYLYSGQVAAYAYKLLHNTKTKRVVMIGPSHRVRFGGVSVNLQSGYETPFGVVGVDEKLANRLLKTSPRIKWIRQAHAYEHCLEIQLPFLQTVLKNFRIVPVLMGEQDIATCSTLAESLVQVLGQSEDTLLLASTDLSHFYNDERARALDGEFIKHVRAFDSDALAHALSSGSCKACGGGSAVAVMRAAKRLGANRAVILKYANSGDVSGDRESVVGYLSAALIRGE